MSEAMETLSTGVVAKLLHVAPRTVSKWIDSGRLKGHRLPGSEHRRVHRADLDAFIKEYSLQPIVKPSEEPKDSAA